MTKAVAGELLSKVALLTDLEALDISYSWVSETCLPLSTALSLACAHSVWGTLAVFWVADSDIRHWQGINFQFHVNESHAGGLR